MFCNKKELHTIRKKVVSLYVVYEIMKFMKTGFHRIRNDPRLANALFGAAKVTQNADIDKYKYFGYGIWFDGHDYFYILVEEQEEM